MTAIANLTLPVLTQIIRGIAIDVPQGTLDRIPTNTFVLADDSGDIRVIYDEQGNFPTDMFTLEDGDRVELEGICLPNGRFFAVSGKMIKK